MEENDLFDKIYAHSYLVKTTVDVIVSAHYLIHHLEDPSFRSKNIFSAALKEQFEILSLDEYEQFMIKNEPFWQLYQKLFLRYRKLNELKN